MAHVNKKFRGREVVPDGLCEENMKLSEYHHDMLQLEVHIYLFSYHSMIS